MSLGAVKPAIGRTPTIAASSGWRSATRTSYNLHTGYREGQGGLVYPSIGAIVSHEVGKKDFPLPNYVAIGGRSFGSGYLGPKNQPLIVNDPNRGVEDLRPVVGSGQFGKRFGLLEDMENAFYNTYQAENINDHKTTYARASHDDAVERSQGLRSVARVVEHQVRLRQTPASARAA